MLEMLLVGFVILLSLVPTVLAVVALSKVPEFSHDMPPELMGITHTGKQSVCAKDEEIR